MAFRKPCEGYLETQAGRWLALTGYSVSTTVSAGQVQTAQGVETLHNAGPVAEQWTLETIEDTDCPSFEVKAGDPVQITCYPQGAAVGKFYHFPGLVTAVNEEYPADGLPRRSLTVSRGIAAEYDGVWTLDADGSYLFQSGFMGAGRPDRPRGDDSGSGYVPPPPPGDGDAGGPEPTTYGDMYLVANRSGGSYLSAWKLTGSDFTALPWDGALSHTWAGDYLGASPDGELLAYANSGGGYVWIYRRDGDSLTEIGTLTGFSGQAFRPVWSRDSQHLFLGTSSGWNAYIYSRGEDDTMTLVGPVDWPGGWCLGAVFSHDNTRLYIGTGPGKVVAYSFTDGATSELAEVDCGAKVYDLALSDDGVFIYASLDDAAGHKLAVIDTRADAMTLVERLDAPGDSRSIAASPDGAHIALGTYHGSPDSIELFDRDPATGQLTPSALTISDGPVWANAAMRYSPDGALLAMTQADRVYVYEYDGTAYVQHAQSPLMVAGGGIRQGLDWVATPVTGGWTPPGEGGGGPAATGTRWDPAATVKASGAASPEFADTDRRAAVGHTDGVHVVSTAWDTPADKIYFEYHLTNPSRSTTRALGLVAPSIYEDPDPQPHSVAPGLAAGPQVALLPNAQDCRAYVSNGLATVLRPLAYADDAIGVAVDLSAGLIWWRDSAGWLRGDPETGTAACAAFDPALGLSRIVYWSTDPDTVWLRGAGSGSPSVGPGPDPDAGTYTAPVGFTALTI